MTLANMSNIFCPVCKQGFITTRGFIRHKNRIVPCTETTPVVSTATTPVVSTETTNTVIIPTAAAPAVPLKPFIKWVGGKTQILEQVLTLFPTTIHDYYEPFVGGGAVLIGLLDAIQQKRITLSGTIYASDINPALINLYKCIQTNPEELLTEIDRLTTITDRDAMGHPILHQETYYYAMRDQYNQLADKTTLQAAALFLYLNKTCFRGMYREGPRGFNVPFGNYRNPTIVDPALIRHLSVLFRPVVFRTCSFETALASIKSDDFTYVDPPYVPLNATSFVGYTADGFDKHQVLFDLLKTLPCPFLLSNSDTYLVRQTFPAPYTIQTISCRRAIHCRNPDARTNEVLIRKAL
jgi:DNA adenine methylase